MSRLSRNKRVLRRGAAFAASPAAGHGSPRPYLLACLLLVCPVVLLGPSLRGSQAPSQAAIAWCAWPRTGHADPRRAVNPPRLNWTDRLGAGLLSGGPAVLTQCLIVHLTRLCGAAGL